MGEINEDYEWLLKLTANDISDSTDGDSWTWEEWNGSNRSPDEAGTPEAGRAPHVAETNRRKDGTFYRKVIHIRGFVEDTELYVIEWDLSEENPNLISDRYGYFI